MRPRRQAVGPQGRGRVDRGAPILRSVDGRRVPALRPRRHRELERSHEESRGRGDSKFSAPRANEHEAVREGPARSSRVQRRSSDSRQSPGDRSQPRTTTVETAQDLHRVRRGPWEATRGRAPHGRRRSSDRPRPMRTRTQRRRGGGSRPTDPARGRSGGWRAGWGGRECSSGAACLAGPLSRGCPMAARGWPSGSRRCARRVKLPQLWPAASVALGQHRGGGERTRAASPRRLHSVERERAQDPRTRRARGCDPAPGVIALGHVAASDESRHRQSCCPSSHLAGPLVFF